MIGIFVFFVYSLYDVDKYCIQESANAMLCFFLFAQLVYLVSDIDQAHRAYYRTFYLSIVLL